MHQRLLSVLICTLPERRISFEKLINELYRQRDLIPNGEELIQVESDDTPRGAIKIGAKRNKLIRLANGTYIAFIDDDDMVAQNYLQLMMEACHSGKDIITFDMDYYIDRIYNKTWVINRFIGCDWNSKRWAMEWNPTHRFTVDRIFYHLCAVKKELVDQVEFIDANNAEDVGYSEALIPLIKTEFHIEHCMLNIYFDTKKIQNV